MQLGGFFVWTYTYQLIRTSSTKHKALEAIEEVPKTPNKDSDADHQTHLLKPQDQDHLQDIIVEPADYIGVATKNQAAVSTLGNTDSNCIQVFSGLLLY